MKALSLIFAGLFWNSPAQRSLARRAKSSSSIVWRAAPALCGLLSALLLWAGGPGFRSRAALDEHYQKHGREFGNISPAEYLRRAQDLRDAPAGGPILEAVKPGGIVTRFDRRTGCFGAYNSDRTIRTFFIPADGERYFHRQARRPN